MTDQLIEGYRRFRREGWAHERARWAELARGQSPQTMIIACSDSRVDPTTIFQTAPGETFVVRNVAALVPPCETGGGRHGVSAALEFAVTQLAVREVVVMGHGGCGGCAAALKRTFADRVAGQGGFIAHWIDLLDAARDRVAAQYAGHDEALHALEHEAVKVSLANLRSFDFVRAREDAGTLTLRGAWFALAEGELYLLDEATGVFAPA